MNKWFKKQIEKYLKKHLTGHPKHYHFLRWLSSIVEDNNKLIDVYASLAGYFYHKQDDYIHLDIMNIMQFTDIFVVDNNVYIYTQRPGMWIGKAGCTIDEVQDRMNLNVNGQKVHDYKIQIIEDTKSADCYIRGAIKIMRDNW